MADKLDMIELHLRAFDIREIVTARIEFSFDCERELAERIKSNWLDEHRIFASLYRGIELVHMRTFSSRPELDRVAFTYGQAMELMSLLDFAMRPHGIMRVYVDDAARKRLRKIRDAIAQVEYTEEEGGCK